MEYSFSERGCGEGGRGFGIDPHVPFACFVSPIPEKRVQTGDGWRLGVLLPPEHPSGVLSRRLHPPPLPGSQRAADPSLRSGNACSVPLTRDFTPDFDPCPPKSRGSRWCCERGVPPRDSGVPPPSFPGRAQEWEAIPVIFKILCTFWGGSMGVPPPPSRRIFSGLTNKKEKKRMVGAFGEGRGGNEGEGNFVLCFPGLGVKGGVWGLFG